MNALLWFLAGFFLVIGMMATGYFIHARMRRNITVTEFRERLKKLLG